MNLWIVYYKNRVEKNIAFINNMINKASEYNITMKLIFVEDIHSLLKSEKPDAVIARFINPALSLELESHGIRVFNNSTIASICNNKALTIKAINELKSIVHIPTIIISKSYSTSKIASYFEVEHVKNFPENYQIIPSLCQYDAMLDNLDIQYDQSTEKNSFAIINPFILNGSNTNYNNINYIKNHIFDNIKSDLSDYIIKSVTGHGGKEVSLLSDFINDNLCFGTQEGDAANFYNERLIIQPKIECGCRDLRVYVIGRRIIGAVLRTSYGGFKSNYSLGGSVSLYQLSDRQIEVINRIIEHFEFDYAGIDFLLGENDELIFNEIEDVVGARMLSECSDIDYVGIYINYIYHCMKSTIF